MKWIVCPSIVVVNCSSVLSRRSCARQSNASRQYVTSSRRYGVSVPYIHASAPCSGSGIRAFASRVLRSRSTLSGTWMVNGLIGVAFCATQGRAITASRHAAASVRTIGTSVYRSRVLLDSVALRPPALLNTTIARHNRDKLRRLAAEFCGRQVDGGHRTNRLPG